MKCSIIVANYNNGKYLSELLESVLNQTYTNWELIVTDDASTDNSIETIYPYLTDKRINLFNHKENQGAAVAFKTSIDNSSGEIIAMLGADDALMPKGIQEIVEQHKKYPNASMVVSNLIKCDNYLKKTTETIKFPDIARNDTILNHFGLSGWDTFKKEFYNKTEGFNFIFKRALDQDLYFKMEEVGEIKHFDEAYYLYRTNPKGISQANNTIFANEYNHLAVINAYNRRKKSGFKNISKKKYIKHKNAYEFLKYKNKLTTKYNFIETVYLDEKEQIIHKKYMNNISLNNEELKMIPIIFERIIKTNQKQNLFPENEFNKTIKSFHKKIIFLSIYASNSKISIKNVLFDKKNNILKKLNITEIFKIVVKQLLRFRI